MDFKLEWNVVCRICLCDGDMFSLFTTSPDTRTSYRDKITQCTNIEIKHDSNLPEQICTKCVDDLEVAYRFRMNCESANAILQSFLEAQTKEVNETKELLLKAEKFKEEPSESDPEENFIVEDDDDDRPSADDSNTEFLENLAFPDDIIVNEEYLNESELNQYEEDFTQSHSELISQQSAVDPSETIVEEYVVPPQQLVEEEENPRSSKMAKILLLTPRPKPTNKQPSKFVRKPIAKTEAGAVAGSTREEGDYNSKNVCEICGNSYKYKHALRVHMRRHAGIKPHTCEICGMKFVIPFELKRHQRTHTGDKPYGCKYCDRKFSDFGSRIKHERTHTGERPYKCDQCEKSFAYSHVLTSHLLIHTGEKKFSCEICGKKFAKNHHLKQHLNVHKDKKLDGGGGGSKISFDDLRRNENVVSVYDDDQQSRFIEIYEDAEEDNDSSVHQIYIPQQSGSFEDDVAMLQVVDKLSTVTEGSVEYAVDE